MTVVRAVLGAAAILAGIGALALAHDLRAWDAALGRGDARYAQDVEGARWSARTWIPGDPAARSLGVRDDVALRRGEQAFTVAVATPYGYDNGRRRTRARALAELALSDAVAAGSPAQASRAGNLLGILAATSDAKNGAPDDERRATETFDAAIRADPGNDDAKHNLELVLRRVRVVGEREGAGGAAGDVGTSLAGAGAGLPGSGY